MEKSKANSRVLLWVACAVSAIGAAIKTAQLIMFFDIASGTILATPMSNALGLAFYIAVGISLIIFIFAAFAAVKAESRILLPTLKILGYVLLLTAAAFLLQGLYNMSGHIIELADLKYVFDEFLMIPSEMISRRLRIIYSLVVDGFCIISGISLCLISLRYIKTGKPSRTSLWIVPPVWGALVLVDLIISVPTVVSIHTDISKITVMVLAEMFLYYFSTYLCGYEKKRTVFSTAIFFSFPIVAMAVLLPMFISMLFGVSDGNVNLPVIAVFGLCIPAFVAMLPALLISPKNE